MPTNTQSTKKPQIHAGNQHPQEFKRNLLLLRPCANVSGVYKLQDSA